MANNIMSLQLNECPYIQHFACGFCFHITFDGKHGIDQFGGKWTNDATNTNSMLPIPVDPEYLNVFLDAYNSIINFNTDGSC